MSKPVNPTAVGGFVIGAIVLIIFAVLVLSSGKLFSSTQMAVVVFPGNVKGLSIGSSVEIRGVRVGSVTDIQVLVDMETNKIVVPVYIEFRHDVIRDLSFEPLSDTISAANWEDKLNAMISAGLKAQINMKSLVTGQMMIAVDYMPEAPVSLTNIDPRYPEIPATETFVDYTLDILQNLPLTEVADKTLDVLTHVDQFLTSQDLKDSVSNIKLLTAQAHKTLVDISTLTHNANNQVQPLSGSAMSALNEATETLNSINDLVGKDSTTRAEMEIMLGELAKAASSLRILTDYLQQHPEALLKGKGY
jgi:paraquat-inducible protein B